jgi:hypothetical protein
VNNRSLELHYELMKTTFCVLERCPATVPEPLEEANIETGVDDLAQWKTEDVLRDLDSPAQADDDVHRLRQYLCLELPIAIKLLGTAPVYLPAIRFSAVPAFDPEHLSGTAVPKLEIGILGLLQPAAIDVAASRSRAQELENVAWKHPDNQPLETIVNGEAVAGQGLKPCSSGDRLVHKSHRLIGVKNLLCL